MKTIYRYSVPFIIVTGLALFYGGAYAGGSVGPLTNYFLILSLIGFISLWAIWTKQKKLWLPKIIATLEKHTDEIDSIPDKWRGFMIALASCMALYIELMFIRWQSSMFMLFGYFKNVTLIGAFLGLGIGFAIGKKRPLFTPLLIPAICIQFLYMFILKETSIAKQLRYPIAESVTLNLNNISTLTNIAACYGFFILIFTLTVFTCIPIGHLTSRLMRKYEALPSYSWNLIGSILGIILFSLISYLWSPPEVWLLLTLLGLLPFLYRGGISVISLPSVISVIIMLVVFALPYKTDSFEIYSPYQRLELGVKHDDDLVLRVGHFFFQQLSDLDTRNTGERAIRLREFYDFPFELKKNPENALIVGSGTGNDVAAAIRGNAGKIDAVEIDPVILRLGVDLHPESPYSDGRVNRIVNDARNFFRDTRKKYDLVVMASLDSHNLLTGMSSVRLESFVYTIESLRQVRSLLTDDGVVVLTFALSSTKDKKFLIGKKIFRMLETVFDRRQPEAYETLSGAGFSFVSGPGIKELPKEVRGSTNVTGEFSSNKSGIDIDMSTDDWPFLYMPYRKYPSSYLVMIIVLLFTSFMICGSQLPSEKGLFSPACFFLGAGFMLIEAKGITELALTFGNTWHVVSIVIIGILVMAFLANAVIIKFGAPNSLVTYSMLAGAVLLGMYYSGDSFSALPPAIAKVVSVALVTLPLFFSGFAFSREIKRYGAIGPALYSNLMGAVLGGFLEYNSMYFGLKSLYVFALALYALAFLSSLRPRPVAGREPALKLSRESSH